MENFIPLRSEVGDLGYCLLLAVWQYLTFIYKNSPHVPCIYRGLLLAKPCAKLVGNHLRLVNVFEVSLRNICKTYTLLSDNYQSLFSNQRSVVLSWSKLLLHIHIWLLETCLPHPINRGTLSVVTA